MQKFIIIALLAAAVAYLAWHVLREVRGTARHGRCYGCSLAERCGKTPCAKKDDHYAEIHSHR